MASATVCASFPSTFDSQPNLTDNLMRYFQMGPESEDKTETRNNPSGGCLGENCHLHQLRLDYPRVLTDIVLVAGCTARIDYCSWKECEELLPCELETCSKRDAYSRFLSESGHSRTRTRRRQSQYYARSISVRMKRLLQSPNENMVSFVPTTQ